MKTSDLFLLVVFTAMDVVFWMTMNPDICAIAFLMVFPLIYGWAALIDDVQKCTNRESKLRKR